MCPTLPSSVQCPWGIGRPTSHHATPGAGEKRRDSFTLSSHISSSQCFHMAYISFLNQCGAPHHWCPRTDTRCWRRASFCSESWTEGCPVPSGVRCNLGRFAEIEQVPIFQYTRAWKHRFFKNNNNNFFFFAKGLLFRFSYPNPEVGDISPMLLLFLAHRGIPLLPSGLLEPAGLCLFLAGRLLLGSVSPHRRAQEGEQQHRWGRKSFCQLCKGTGERGVLRSGRRCSEPALQLRRKLCKETERTTVEIMSCASWHPGTLFWLKARWRGASEEALVLSHGTQPLGKDLPLSNFPHALLMEALLPCPPTETPLETNPPFKNDRLTFTRASGNWFSPKLDLGVYYRAQGRINK